MFGLSFEKIVLVGIIAVIVIGPSRLPSYAQKLGELVRLLRSQLDVAKDRAAESLGAEDWQTLDPRQYDPRRIIREALDEQAPVRSAEGEPGAAGAPTDTAAEAPGRFVISGSSGHPRKRLVAHTTGGHLGAEEGAAVGSTADR